MSPEIREATRADLEEFCAGRLGPSVKAIAAVLDGRVIGVAGLAFKDGVVVAFCDTTDELKRFRTFLHRRAVAFMREARAGHRMIYAQMSHEEPTAKRWLTRLGFTPVDEG